MSPLEILLSDEAAVPEYLNGATQVRHRPEWHFDTETGKRLLCRQFNTLDLSGFGAEGIPRAISAAGCLMQYVKDTQRAELPHIRTLTHERHDDAVIMDVANVRWSDVAEKYVCLFSIWKSGGP